MEMTCSECGEVWACRDVLSREHRLLPGFWEHESPGRLAGGCLRTFSWLVIPSRFWRRVSLHHELRPKRLLAWAIGLPLGLMVGAALVRGIFFLSLILRGAVDRWDVDFRDNFSDMLTLPFAVVRQSGWSWNLHRFDVMYNVLPFVLATIVYPAMLLLLLQSRGVARLRWIHIARAAAYSTSLLIVLAAIEVVIALSVTAPAIVRPPTAAAWHGGTFVRTGFSILTEDLRRTIYGDYWLMWTLRYVYVAWLAWYWNRAIVVGFRLKRGWAIWSLLTAIMLLVCLGLRYALITKFYWDLLQDASF